MKTPQTKVKPRVLALPAFEVVVANMNVSVLGVVTIRFIAPLTEYAKVRETPRLSNLEFSLTIDDAITVRRCSFGGLKFDKDAEATLIVKAEVETSKRFIAEYPNLLESTVELKLQQTGEAA